MEARRLLVALLALVAATVAATAAARLQWPGRLPATRNGGGARFFVPVLARPEVLCGQEEVFAWHWRYGHADGLTRVCELNRLGRGGEVLRRPLFEPVESAPAARVASIGRAVVQREGAVFVGPGESLQGGRCCYCSPPAEPLALREPGSEVDCLRTKGDCKLPYFGAVLTISTTFGSEFAHFFKESLPRLGPFLDRALANPALRIHVKRRGALPVPLFINQTLELLGIRASRVVTGDIVAGEVLVPPFATCGTTPDQLGGLLAVRDALLRAAGVGPPQALVLVLERRVARRSWSNERLENVWDAVVRGVGGRFRVQRVRDDDTALMECVACQIRLFSRAMAVVGAHGAGLTNVMFMPAGGAVVELGFSRQQSEYLMHAHALGHQYAFFDWDQVAHDDWDALARLVERVVVPVSERESSNYRR